MKRIRSRRAALRAGALAVCSLAGCVDRLGDWDGGEPGGTAGTTTRDAIGATTDGGRAEETRTPSETTPPADVELVPRSVQSSFFYRASPDTLDVESVDGVQFLFVSVRPRTDSPPPSDLTLTADGDRYWGTLAPGDVGGPRNLAELGPGYRYEDAAAGWVAFEVPNPLDAEEVALRHDGRSQALDDDLLAALRDRPADFDLVSFEAPERVTRGESFEVSFAVENVGESDGTFRAGLNRVGPTSASRRSEFSLAAGERRERTLSVGDGVTPDTEHVGIEFRSAVADRETTVDVTDAAAPE